MLHATRSQHEEGAGAVVHPVQYELEQAYHQRREANAARQRLIEDAERISSVATTAQRSLFEGGARVWRRVVSSRLPMRSRVVTRSQSSETRIRTRPDRIPCTPELAAARARALPVEISFQ